ncbi:MAG: ATP-binding protein [Clostridia bacterium]|nr:ATP-binding protein [Clostridia bacterium]
MTRKECYEQCVNEVQNARLARAAKREEGAERLKKENPRFAEICELLSALSPKVARAAISGDTVELEHLKDTVTVLGKERAVLLKSAGIGGDDFACEKCRDTGFVNGKYCDCIKQAARELAVKNLAAVAPVDSCRFENFDLSFYPDADTENGNPKKRMTEILKLCKEYTLNFDPEKSDSLLFIGNTGLGKTHLSLAMAYELLMRGFDVIYGSAYNLFARMEKEHFSEHNDNYYGDAVSCDLLIIDDLGGEFVSPYVQSLVYNIINTRLLARKPTVINTNLSMAEINRIYTPRVASRLLGEYVAKKFIGSDIRQQKSIKK